MSNIDFRNIDCMEGMKEYPDNYFDLAIVDPPYGINVTARHKAKRDTVPLVGGGGRAFGGSKNSHDRRKQVLKVPSKFYHPFDDSATPDGRYFEELFRVSKAQIIWGGNFFLDYLGACSCMIVWDKGRRGMDQADCEIAWTSLKGQNRIFNWKWNGMLQEDMKHKEERIHACQKPVALYEWILTRFAKPGDKILDTHVGSASSLIACHNLNFDAVGFEIDKTYYELAKARLDAVQAQMNIFDFLKNE